MVFTSLVALVRSKGPDEFWRKRKVFQLAARFRGKSRNCYSIAIRNVLRSLAKATKGRALKRQDMRDLWQARIDAAAQEHGANHIALKDGLSRANVFLDSKILANLAVFEPRSFKALMHLAWNKSAQEGSTHAANLGPPPPNVGIRNLKDS